jgi:hypothetical protein
VNRPTSSLINSTDDVTHADVLLIYVYANVHQHAYANLKYFIETAVRERDGVDYIFILQQTEQKQIDETQMPPLPKGNAFYFQHENKCFDYGTMGWFFDKYTVGNPWRKETSITNNSNSKHHDRRFNLTKYKYFIFMNSSIRGPFFPPYFIQFLFDYQRELNEPFYWYYVFTKRIDDKVKLVGPTIACTPLIHVQSYLLTTDFTGLSLLLKSATSGDRVNAGVFACHGSQYETTFMSEIAITTQILESGYMINCLISKYQTIDFSKKDYHKCTIYGSPYTDKWVDGTSLEPYEVVFVKYNDKKLTTDAQERAKLYQRWMEEVKTKNRASW